MKCIINTQTGDIYRVTDASAESKVKASWATWEYCGKQQWKASLKPVPSVSSVVELTVKKKSARSERRNERKQTNQ